MPQVSQTRIHSHLFIHAGRSVRSHERRVSPIKERDGFRNHYRDRVHDSVYRDHRLARNPLPQEKSKAEQRTDSAVGPATDLGKEELDFPGFGYIEEAFDRIDHRTRFTSVRCDCKIRIKKRL
jgi:hypothetical protein